MNNNILGRMVFRQLEMHDQCSSTSRTKGRKAGYCSLTPLDMFRSKYATSIAACPDCVSCGVTASHVTCNDGME